MKNLIVKNTSIKGANNAHLLELSGVKNVTVSGASFSEYDGNREKEAIQIETIKNDAGSPGCAPYDYTNSSNIVIYCCSFKNLPRGVGHHSTVLGIDNTYILIKKNSFENIAHQAVLTTSMKHVRITNNTMKQVGVGVDVTIAIKKDSTNVAEPTTYALSYADLQDSGYTHRDITVKNSTISATGSSSLTEHEGKGLGISVRGMTIASSSSAAGQNAAGNYRISGVRIKNNTIKTANGTGIRFMKSKGCSASSNTIEKVSTAKGRALGFYVNSSPDLALTGNKVKAGAKQGVYAVTGSTDLTITGNTFNGLRKEGVYATGTCSRAKVEKNVITTSGTTALQLGSSSQGAFKLTKKTRKALVGKTAARAKVTLYVNGKKRSSAKANKRGAFSFKLKKKLKAGSTVRLQRTTSSGNKIRTTFTVA